MDIIENEIMAVECTPYAAAVHSIYLKKHGRFITHRLGKEEEHCTDSSYSGCTIFPFAGRIRNACFDGIELDANDGKNSLHGGSDAHIAVFSKESATDREVTYSLKRYPGDDRLPSERCYMVRFSVFGNSLHIDLMMESDIPTLCDMTSHIYFNLSDTKYIGDHLLQIDADKVVLNRPDHTAECMTDVDDTIFDFTSFRKLRHAIDAQQLSFSHGLNNAYILRSGGKIRLRYGQLEIDGTSDSKAVVIYSGGFLDPASSYVAIEFQDIPLEAERTVTDVLHRHIEFSAIDLP